MLDFLKRGEIFYYQMNVKSWAVEGCAECTATP